MASPVERLDNQLAALLADWSLLTTLIALAVVALFAYPLIFTQDPDTHPLLLARQSSIAPVRNKNESAVYRSQEVPYGYPLKSGLNVKDAGAPRWATGKDGDLRDVWREVQRGGTTGPDGKETPQGLIMTVLGKQEIIEHEVADISKEIKIIGEQLKASGQTRVAIYLPNSLEYLSALFACSFYGLTPILLPYNLPHPKVYEILSTTDAGALICAAGNLPLEDLASACPKIHQLTWVVEKTSRHMDWNGVPSSAQDRLAVNVWHDLVSENFDSTTDDLPTNDTGPAPQEVLTISQNLKDVSQPPIITPFTHTNLTSATAALISALPGRQRFSPADLVLPASSLHLTYVLCQTLAALYTHANLALTSVAEPGVDLALARRGISPTVIIASAETLAKLHQQETAGISSMLQKVGKASQAQTMSAGRMPTDGLLFRLLAPSAANPKPGQLALILTSHRLHSGCPELTSTMLSDLRIFTRARICYALTVPSVAGAVAQTNMFDYRREDGQGCAKFGAPLSSVEVKVKGEESEGSLGSEVPRGELVVMGPAVGGGDKEVGLGVQGFFGQDGTLGLV